MEGARALNGSGQLSIVNNAAERALRTIAVGRNNWNYVGNERGGKGATVFYSLVRTAAGLGLEPRTYIRDLLLHRARAGRHEAHPARLETALRRAVQAHQHAILDRIVPALA